MSKYIPSWEFWDWSSIFKASLLLSLLVGFIIFSEDGSDIIRKEKEKRLDAETTAQITSVEQYTSVGIYANSSTEYLDAIVVKYTYFVNTNKYSEWEVIPDNVHNRKFVRALLSSPESTIQIKYSSSRPDKSVIIVDSLLCHHNL